ncbi:NADH-cytochrome b5 reductase [Theileria orientalis strain Shintoku]|uniref:NADH-cytochrome b5 reductase n=1 Tax=Theileria orientalis strain Shintoku TaxID=869250 RepID=J4D7M9_THEOR|nr:NADH-cytochrome b5 reductase [Theileria orientalis strain Shintoku]BAM40270.1 NADH-cytochrome b5 reductase [Theileria orientalis strain Shintoku]|eukprot:XP_009690571.1 NADH-cytochrome b5 reductase [Theileria orientalis strain Shintoku]
MGPPADLDVEIYLKKEKIGINLKNIVDEYIYDLELVKKVKTSPTSFLFVFEYTEDIANIIEVDIFSAFVFIGTHHQPTVPGLWNNRPLEDQGGLVRRKYAPIYIDVDKRQIHFLIRIYRQSELYPDGGKLTRYLDDILVTEQVNITSWRSKHKVVSNNVIKSLATKVEFETLNLAAGGTGITPFVRLLNYYQDLPVDINLVYCNSSVEEIMLKQVFDKFADINKRLKVTYLVSKRERESEGVVEGRISQEVVEAKFENTEGALCLFCGPPGFNDLISHLNRFVAKAIVLSKLVKLRLAQPLLKGSVEDSNRSMSASIKAVGFLSKIVPILKMSQAWANKSPVSSTTALGARKKGSVRLHNREEQVWRVLRPGRERETKHLRWRK